MAGRRRAWWVVWLFAIFALAPAAAYLQAMFPDWNLLYVASSQGASGGNGSLSAGSAMSAGSSMSRAMPIFVGLAMIASALLGWAVAERAGRRLGRLGWPQATSRLITGVLFGLAGLLLALLVRGRLLLVGTYEQFHDGQWLMQPLFSASSKLPLALLVINAGLVVALGLGVQLLRWRSDLLVAPSVPAPASVGSIGGSPGAASGGAAASELPAPTSPVPRAPDRSLHERDAEGPGYESQSAR